MKHLHNAQLTTPVLRARESHQETVLRDLAVIFEFQKGIRKNLELHIHYFLDMTSVEEIGHFFRFNGFLSSSKLMSGRVGEAIRHSLLCRKVAGFNHFPFTESANEKY